MRLLVVKRPRAAGPNESRIGASGDGALGFKGLTLIPILTVPATAQESESLERLNSVVNRGDELGSITCRFRSLTTMWSPNRRAVSSGFPMTSSNLAIIASTKPSSGLNCRDAFEKRHMTISTLDKFPSKRILVAGPRTVVARARGGKSCHGGVRVGTRESRHLGKASTSVAKGKRKEKRLEPSSSSSRDLSGRCYRLAKRCGRQAPFSTTTRG